MSKVVAYDPRLITDSLRMTYAELIIKYHFSERKIKKILHESDVDKADMRTVRNITHLSWYPLDTSKRDEMLKLGYSARVIAMAEGISRQNVHDYAKRHDLYETWCDAKNFRKVLEAIADNYRKDD